MKKISLVIIVMILIFGGAWYLLSLKPQNEKLSDSKSPVVTESVTYTNATYGFSFITPKGWRISNGLSSFWDVVNENPKINTSELNNAILKWKPETAAHISLTDASEKDIVAYLRPFRADISNLDNSTSSFVQSDHTIDVQIVGGDFNIELILSFPKLRSVIHHRIR